MKKTIFILLLLAMSSVFASAKKATQPKQESDPGTKYFIQSKEVSKKEYCAYLLDKIKNPDPDTSQAVTDTRQEMYNDDCKK